MKIEKKYIRNIVIIIISGFIIYVILSFFQGFGKICTSFSEYRIEYFFYSFFCICFTWIIESVMLRTAFGGIKRVSLPRSFRIAMITQFFNLITPFYTGGQPFTVYYYSKEGIGYEKSIAAILYKTFTFQVAISVLGIICLSFFYGSVSTLSAGIAVAGISINLGMALLMFTIGRSRKIGKIVTDFVLKILSKLKLIRNPDKVKNEIDKRTGEFINTFDQFGRQWKIFAMLCIMNAVNYLMYAFSAVLIIMGTGVEFSFENFGKVVLMNISASSIPTPGTSGGIEGLFYLFMGKITSTEEITLAIFLWRAASYYLSILVSAIFVFRAFSKDERDLSEISENPER